MDNDSSAGGSDGVVGHVSSTDALMDEAQVEELLSEKLLDGFVLLERACPRCATPLVRQERLPPPESSVAPKKKKQQHDIDTPIPGVPFCVSCRAHVMTDESDIVKLQQHYHGQALQGRILIDVGQKENGDDDGKDEKFKKAKQHSLMDDDFDDDETVETQSSSNYSPSPGSHRHRLNPSDNGESESEEGGHQPEINVVDVEQIELICSRSLAGNEGTNVMTDAIADAESVVASVIVSEHGDYDKEDDEEDSKHDNQENQIVSSAVDPSPANQSTESKTIVKADTVPTVDSSPMGQRRPSPAFSAESKTIVKADTIATAESSPMVAASESSPIVGVNQNPSGLSKTVVKARTMSTVSSESSPVMIAGASEHENNMAIVRDENWPSFEDRKLIATKVLSVKLLQGHQLLQKQCNLCSMPLTEYKGKTECAVCPILKRRVVKARDRRVQKEREQARRLEETDMAVETGKKVVQKNKSMLLEKAKSRSTANRGTPSPAGSKASSKRGTPSPAGSKASSKKPKDSPAERSTSSQRSKLVVKTKSLLTPSTVALSTITAEKEMTPVDNGTEKTSKGNAATGDETNAVSGVTARDTVNDVATNKPAETAKSDGPTSKNHQSPGEKIAENNDKEDTTPTEDNASLTGTDESHKVVSVESSVGSNSAAEAAARNFAAMRSAPDAMNSHFLKQKFPLSKPPSGARALLTGGGCGPRPSESNSIIASSVNGSLLSRASTRPRSLISGTAPSIGKPYLRRAYDPASKQGDTRVSDHEASKSAGTFSSKGAGMPVRPVMGIAKVTPQPAASVSTASQQQRSAPADQPAKETPSQHEQEPQPTTVKKTDSNQKGLPSDENSSKFSSMHSDSTISSKTKVFFKGTGYEAYHVHGHHRGVASGDPSHTSLPTPKLGPQAFEERQPSTEDTAAATASGTENSKKEGSTNKRDSAAVDEKLPADSAPDQPTPRADDGQMSREIDFPEVDAVPSDEAGLDFSEAGVEATISFHESNQRAATTETRDEDTSNPAAMPEAGEESQARSMAVRRQLSRLQEEPTLQQNSLTGEPSEDSAPEMRDVESRASGAEEEQTAPEVADVKSRKSGTAEEEIAPEIRDMNSRASGAEEDEIEEQAQGAIVLESDGQEDKQHEMDARSTASPAEEIASRGLEEDEASSVATRNSHGSNNTQSEEHQHSHAALKRSETGSSADLNASGSKDSRECIDPPTPSRASSNDEIDKHPPSRGVNSINSSTSDLPTTHDHHSHQEPPTPTGEVAPDNGPPTTVGHQVVSLSPNPISAGAFEVLARTTGNQQKATTLADFESRRRFASKEIGKRMMKGWRLLNSACPKCATPLMADRGNNEVCVICGLPNPRDDREEPRSSAALGERKREAIDPGTTGAPRVWAVNSKDGEGEDAESSGAGGMERVDRKKSSARAIWSSVAQQSHIQPRRRQQADSDPPAVQGHTLRRRGAQDCEPESRAPLSAAAAASPGASSVWSAIARKDDPLQHLRTRRNNETQLEIQRKDPEAFMGMAAAKAPDPSADEVVLNQQDEPQDESEQGNEESYEQEDSAHGKESASSQSEENSVQGKTDPIENRLKVDPTENQPEEGLEFPDEAISLPFVNDHHSQIATVGPGKAKADPIETDPIEAKEDAKTRPGEESEEQQKLGRTEEASHEEEKKESEDIEEEPESRDTESEVFSGPPPESLSVKATIAPPMAQQVEDVVRFLPSQPSSPFSGGPSAEDVVRFLPSQPSSPLSGGPSAVAYSVKGGIPLNVETEVQEEPAVLQRTSSPGMSAISPLAPFPQSTTAASEAERVQMVDQPVGMLGQSPSISNPSSSSVSKPTLSSRSRVTPETRPRQRKKQTEAPRPRTQQAPRKSFAFTPEARHGARPLSSMMSESASATAWSPAVRSDTSFAEDSAVLRAQSSASSVHSVHSLSEARSVRSSSSSSVVASELLDVVDDPKPPPEAEISPTSYGGMSEVSYHDVSGMTHEVSGSGSSGASPITIASSRRRKRQQYRIEKRDTRSASPETIIILDALEEEEDLKNMHNIRDALSVRSEEEATADLSTADISVTSEAIDALLNRIEETQAQLTAAGEEEDSFEKREKLAELLDRLSAAAAAVEELDDVDDEDSNSEAYSHA